jgi:flagellar hook-associated protein 3 FlgL
MSNAARISTANGYDNSIRNITTRQAELVNLQENLTSGKRVVRPSDDPTNAANAERAMTRLSRIATDQRALESQRNSIQGAESILGDVTDALQRFRELVVKAGSGTNTSSDRKTIAVELQGLRDQIVDYANRKDTNGLPLFSALGSALTPFVGPQATAPDYTFNGLPGQSASSEVSIPFALDGDAAFMHQPARDGVFNAAISTIPTGRTLTTDNVTVSNTALVNTTASASALAGATYPTYTLTFDAVVPDPVNPTNGPSTTTYTITENPPVTAGFPITSPPITFTPGISTTIAVSEIPGLSFSIKGTPAEFDTITVDQNPSVFSVMDDAIRDIGLAANNNSATQAVGQALHNLDIGMERISATRGQAGELLNRVDRISANQENRSIQLEADRSRAEDLDMVKGISDFNNKQTGYQAALQTYSQVQKLSLFNYIS